MRPTGPVAEPAPTSLLREFLRAPWLTATVAPSSRWLGAQMVVPIPERGEPVVVELGPGTGAFTGLIQDRLAGRGRHLAIELNPRLAAQLSRRFPGVEVVHADAVRLPELMAGRGLHTADVVVSGLPWVAYRPDGDPPLLSVVARALAYDGVFTQFAYGWTRWAPPARRYLRDLRAAFEEVTLSRTVWRNLPPALVYLARRAR
ncbi:phospholipid N-methyltransferase [Thermocatellispora tengchongensis]|uniref:Phospholipid N-methyltransferase n=1 Tax=Thermocatellispora tengchongensis TaxID=1073253 RepID=A0A840PEI2_9ACTN|nr:SAM-dependent methyltransferase [Thermocatellispora tengchongensis]MBB5134445.1 phospholipid N-methyltransferase [Thermocatellispora tengchongensis]